MSRCPPASDKPRRDVELIPRLATTTQLAHGPKKLGGILAHPRYAVAYPHWEIYYNKDLREKLKLRAWRTPLTMGKQMSETKERFPGWPNLPHDPTFHAGPQPFGLAAFHNNGASKDIVPSTENKELAGKPFYIRDKAVLRLNEPYVTITAQDYRPYTERLLPGYARKDPPTCQAVGPYPLIREVGPMRDIRLFPKPTRVPRLAPNTTHVPHRGLLTQTQESYQPPNDPKITWDRFCPVEKPPISSYTVPVPEIMCVPLMYETEYKCYGSGKPKPV
ncbi:hypothetical protein lerEdw1_006490 [Lerista edwardsae]|nr:hypothetical protein lerEdw1_006490 [Lerista edwardsae]